jgi:GntR family transcriptional regulator / MocR family aminotransferase
VDHTGKKLACDVLIDVDGAGPGPLHERLTRSLRTAIRDGLLPPGSALPASRALAADLGCSRWVVTQAYEQLIAEGYLEARTGSATRVRPIEQSPRAVARRTPPVAPRQGARFDLAPGLPDLRAFPRQRWAEAVRAQLSTLSYAELGHPAPEGALWLRDVLAAYLRRVRGADAIAADVTICASVTDGVARLCRRLLADGHTKIAVENPGWTRLRQTIAGLGLEPVGIGVDDHGLRVDELAARNDVRAVLLTPAHQFPTGVVFAPKRRAQLLEWARSVDGLVLEDDYDAEFRYGRRPVGTLQGTEPSHVVLYGSLSKTMSPALGLGWMVTPPQWTERVRAVDVAAPPPPMLDQLTFAGFLGSGGYDRHLRTARQRYRRRRDALVEELTRQLPGHKLSGAAAGLHLVLELEQGTEPGPILEHAARADLRLVSLDAYRMTPDPEAPGLVLGYGNLADNAVVPAVNALRRAIEAVR